MALVAFFTVHHFFLTPPLIDSGGARGNVYSSCHAVGWSFNNDLDPLVTDSFDVESTEKVQEYVDGALSYKMEVNDEIRRDIQRLCREARHERGIVIIVASIFFAVVFLSVPKPRRSCNGARNERVGSKGQVSNGEGTSSDGMSPIGKKNDAESINRNPGDPWIVRGSDKRHQPVKGNQIV